MSKLVIALDYTDAMDALSMCSQLQGTDVWMKVGLELFTREGPRVVQTLKSMGFQVMLDLKLHDIPNTVQGAVRAASWIGVDMMTLHLIGGERMCRAAVEEVARLDHKPLLFGVTVLTSMEQGEMPIDTDIHTLAFELAGKASSWGLDGVVCSGLEAQRIKAQYPALQCLTPGIRPQGSKADDQRRTVTPAQAVKAGADYLVVGRPVTKAENPQLAAKEILASMHE